MADQRTVPNNQTKNNSEHERIGEVFYERVSGGEEDDRRGQADKEGILRIG